MAITGLMSQDLQMHGLWQVASNKDQNGIHFFSGLDEIIQEEHWIKILP